MDVFVAELPDGLVERPSRHPGNGRFPGRINLGHDQDVGLVEGGGEAVHEQRKPGIAVRLENDHQPALPAALGGVQSRLDLGWMMAVVFDDHDSADVFLPLEPPSYPRIVFQRLR
jgi:hypothetical protein